MQRQRSSFRTPRVGGRVNTLNTSKGSRSARTVLLSNQPATPFLSPQRHGSDNVRMEKKNKWTENNFGGDSRLAPTRKPNSRESDTNLQGGPHTVRVTNSVMVTRDSHRLANKPDSRIQTPTRTTPFASAPTQKNKLKLKPCATHLQNSILQNSCKTRKIG